MNLSKDIDRNLLARLLSYQSYSDIFSCMHCANLIAVQVQAPEINMDHIEQAMDIMQFGCFTFEHNNEYASKAAHHEAGHAVSRIFNDHYIIHKVDIQMHGVLYGCGGYVESLPISEQYKENKNDAENHIQILLAGGVAEQFLEKKWFETIDVGFEDLVQRYSISGDLKCARKNAR